MKNVDVKLKSRCKSNDADSSNRKKSSNKNK
jgi:hypothetical protein